jgi:c-di-GMP-binding flagellar brake protein YcgR
MTATHMPPPPPLPQLRQDIVVTLPDKQQYRGRVTRVTDEEIVLVLMLDARDPLQPGDVTTMVVEYAGARGLVRLEGRGTVATYDLIRFRLEGAVDVVQRRDFVRVRVVRPLQLAHVGVDDAVGEWTESMTVNVSGNGLLAAGPETLRIGDAVAFRVALNDGDTPVEGRGRVARLGDDGQRGIAIEEIDRDARRHLVRFVFEQERIARQRTRDGEL